MKGIHEKLGSGVWKYALAVLLLHAAGFALLAAASKHPAVWGLGLISYALGLRHAFDADHIAAIDNTTRKLMQQKRDAAGVGFFFSLGHSSVVVLMAVATALSAHWAQRRLPLFQEIGGVVGASVSGLFLVIVGLANLFILAGLVRVIRRHRLGQATAEELEKAAHPRGFVTRMIKPLIKLVGRSWHVYPLGFLFGLGFDTASEIALLTLSGTAANQAVPMAGILAFPILFAAGMTLMDTANGIFMVRAYRWALDEPLRKLYFNLTVTVVTVAAALSIGLIELVQVLSEHLGGSGKLAGWVRGVEFGPMGYGLAALFLILWLVYYAVWRIRSKFIL